MSSTPQSIPKPMPERKRKITVSRKKGGTVATAPVDAAVAATAPVDVAVAPVDAATSPVDAKPATDPIRWDEHSNYTEAPWDIIGSYFQGQHLERLVRHQVESYNLFVNHQREYQIFHLH